MTETPETYEGMEPAETTEVTVTLPDWTGMENFDDSVSISYENVVVHTRDGSPKVYYGGPRMMDLDEAEEHARRLLAAVRMGRTVVTS
ncbi:gp58 [Rhodococcus phage ReqiPine5]|uniref:Gp58 n=1 Tax=Rhodococcus phage ReqiPine5 TaxID=691963 RepID=D4P833_9CAUD|nr:gp58 [Rhodococcus phage ReqiPine5]ADD81163.1 gp58 [Rhodococcus phage ReqiPine5]